MRLRAKYITSTQNTFNIIYNIQDNNNNNYMRSGWATLIPKYYLYIKKYVHIKHMYIFIRSLTRSYI